MEIDEEWAYRKRDQDPSERVRILAIEKKRQGFRADVEFLDGERVGVRENVPGRRLKALWSDVAAYDHQMAEWERLREITLTPVEDYAVIVALESLIPPGIAEHHYGPVEAMTVVTDREALEGLLAEPLDFVLGRCEWLVDDDGATVVSPRGTLLIAELACRKNPMPILDNVIEEEKKARHYSKHGRTEPGRGGEDERRYSAEEEHEWYLQWTRPRHEILRQWCGHRPVVLQERLIAAEAEVQRLDELLTRVLDCLESTGDSNARVFTREHVEDRVTPENIRPVVERPLGWWDVPAPPERRHFRRRWW
ncbi:hypothetical protein [Prescottella equi]|uniref:hypothetical protein n=1 Tax=Rhodococcus hoagii TaxID=43767 RepID=UPI00111BDC63|nr:hypothetical protein [Prescottella equi]